MKQSQKDLVILIVSQSWQDCSTPRDNQTINQQSVNQSRSSLFLRLGFESVGPIPWNAFDPSMHNLVTADFMIHF